MTKKKKDPTPANEEIEKLKSDLEQMTEAAKRAMADLQNFKRRTEEERAELQVFANTRLLEAIFPAIDNLTRALESTPEELQDNEWVKGIAATQSSLITALQALGLETIDQTGVPVDPNRHEVLMEGEGPTGEVIQVFEKGYSFKDKTVRPAKVQVGKVV